MSNLNYTIRIAIAGKREHPNLYIPDTAKRIDEILAVLNGIHNKLWSKLLNDKPSDKANDIYNDIAPQADLKVQFLSGLADGADQLVTSKVDSFGYSNVNGKVLRPFIDAILPFTADWYRNHPSYPIEDIKIFDPLLIRADRRIYVNDEAISKKLCSGTKEEIGSAANRAYEAQALLMLRRCDILLAVADPKEKVKPGGTHHTINKARAYHIPVLFLSLADYQIYILNDDSTSYETVEMLIARGQVKPATEDNIEDLFKETLSQQTPKSVEGVDVDFENLIFVKGYKSPNSDRLFVRWRKNIWEWINGKMGKNADKKLVDKKIEIKVGSKLERLTDISNFQKNMEDVNTAFSYQYRGGFILNNLLAIIAVSIAVFMMLLGIYSHLCDFSEAVIFTVVIVILICLKYLTLRSILGNTKAATDDNWNDKSILTRYLAERLRVYEFLYANNILRGIKPLRGKHMNDKFKGSPPEAIYRKIEGYMSVENGGDFSLDPIVNMEKFNKGLVWGQINFHSRTSNKYEFLDELLDEGGAWLNKLTIGLVFADGIILALNKILPEYDGCHCSQFIEWLHLYGTPFFVLLTALFPAIISAFNAVRFQSESKKLKERYATMYELLSRKSENIQTVLDSLKVNPKGSDILELFPLITEIEQIMLDEISDWTLLYSKEFFES